MVVTLTAIYTFKSKPVYRATAQVGIESETPQLQTLNSLYQNLPTDEAFLRTQVKVLQSDNLFSNWGSPPTQLFCLVHLDPRLSTRLHAKVRGFS